MTSTNSYRLPLSSNHPRSTGVEACVYIQTMMLVWAVAASQVFQSLQWSTCLSTVKGRLKTFVRLPELSVSSQFSFHRRIQTVEEGKSQCSLLMTHTSNHPSIHLPIIGVVHMPCHWSMHSGFIPFPSHAYKQLLPRDKDEMENSPCLLSSRDQDATKRAQLPPLSLFPWLAVAVELSQEPLAVPHTEGGSVSVGNLEFKGNHTWPCHFMG